MLLRYLKNQISFLIGWVDGSWKEENGLQATAFGRFMYDRKFSRLYIFSGPLSKCSVFDTDVEALYFVLRAHATSPCKDKKLAVFVDSQAVAHHFNVCKRSPDGLLDNWVHNYKVVFINRYMNSVTDHLASEGRKKMHMVEAWVK